MAVVTETNPVEELVGRLFMEGVGTMHLMSVYLGVRLGLFRALSDGGPQTSAQLAAASGLDEWYVREWLQAETIAGLVSADADDLSKATFTAADGVRETLVEETSAAYLGGLTFVTPAVGRILPDLLDAFRTGAGVPYQRYGPEAVEAQASLNRPAFVNELVVAWLPAVPDVLERLQDTEKPARVAD